jgi:N-acetylglucosamine-6-sulfatase
VEFLEQKHEKPFCLYLAHKAIHPNVQQRDDGSVSAAVSGSDAFIPAERHRTLYAGKTPPRRPSYGKVPRGKPALERRIGNLPPLGPETVTPDATVLNRMRMMKAVDEGLGQMLATLEKSRRLDDTVVIFTSDHGYFYGEHGLDPERRLAYEEAIRVPLVVRYPRRFQAAARPDRMVLSIDIAPTVFELAGVKASWPLHGRSLLDPTRREEILVEYYSDTVFPRIRNMGYRAVRTEDWKYIRYLELEGMDELYDLRHDPYEMNNVLTKAPGARVDMQRRLQRLLDLL